MLSAVKTTTPTINWGVIGCGAIAPKWARAIDKAGHRIAAVASRDKAKGDQFIKDLSLKDCVVYDDYQALIEHGNLQAVYISVPTTKREEWVLKCLQAGLHVLMEKPHVNAQEVGLMLDLANQKGLQLMDGVMFVHSERLKQMGHAIENGALGGRPLRVMSMFSAGRLEVGNIRLDPTLEPQGTLADLGTYCVRLSLWAFNWDLPERVKCEATSVHAGALEGVIGSLFYDDGRVATFDANNSTCDAQWAHISGPKASMKIPLFVVPEEGHSRFSIEKNEWGDMFNILSNVDDKKVGRCIQEGEAIATFSKLINEKHATDVNWGMQALKTQLVLDACFESASARGVEVMINKDWVNLLTAKLCRARG
jgi:predicted dehydrogenase